MAASNGNDTLIGSLGSDNLSGGSGNDNYLFESGDGIDTIVDSAGRQDKVMFGDSIAQGSVAFFMNGDNPEVSYGAGADLITVQNQNISGNSVERFEAGNGQYLTSNDVN